MAGFTSAGTSIILRLEIDKELVSFGQIATAIGEAGGDIVAIDVTRAGKTMTTRDITVNISDQNQTDVIIKSICELQGSQNHQRIGSNLPDAYRR